MHHTLLGYEPKEVQNLLALGAGNQKGTASNPPAGREERGAYPAKRTLDMTQRAFATVRRLAGARRQREASALRVCEYNPRAHPWGLRSTAGLAYRVPIPAPSPMCTRRMRGLGAYVGAGPHTS